MAELSEIIDIVMAGPGAPDRVLVGKQQLRWLAPFWAESQADAVRILYNRGYRGDDLVLTKEECWRLA